MDTMSALAKGKEARMLGNKTKYASKSKIISLMKKHNVKKADLGLIEDWFWTGGTIELRNEAVKIEFNGYVFSYSIWATPTLIINGKEYDVSTYDVKDSFKNEMWSD